MRDRPPPRHPFLPDLLHHLRGQGREQQLANQTCYGISERCIAALISIHGDDKGLILPPAVAPVQAIIVPITIGKRHDDVLAAAKKLESDLKAAGFRVKMDTRDMRPGPSTTGGNSGACRSGSSWAPEISMAAR